MQGMAETERVCKVSSSSMNMSNTNTNTNTNANARYPVPVWRCQILQIMRQPVSAMQQKFEHDAHFTGFYFLLICCATRTRSNIAILISKIFFARNGNPLNSTTVNWNIHALPKNWDTSLKLDLLLLGLRVGMVWTEVTVVNHFTSCCPIKT